MHKDFLTALWNNENPREVYDRLCRIEDAVWNKNKRELLDDLEMCDHIRFALREPIGSAPYEWAQSFMREAQVEEEKKPPRQIAYEKRRREIEREYLRLKEAESERMKQAIRKRLEEEEREMGVPSTASVAAATVAGIIKRSV